MRLRNLTLSLIAISFSFGTVFGSATEVKPCEKKKWLPVIAICTDEKVQKDEEIQARYRIFEELEGKTLSLEEVKKITSCKNKDKEEWQTLSMKRRGNSSDKFSKKQYLLKFYKADGDKRKVSLGGLPKASKWVFHAPYVDQSGGLRNLVTYDLGRALGEERNEPYFSPRTKPYEFFMDGDYRGLYIIIDKIERGKHKVDLEKFNDVDHSSMTFIAELSSDSHVRAHRGLFDTKGHTRIKYRYPDIDKIEEIGESDPERAEAIISSIKSIMNRFEMCLRKPKLLTETIQDPKQDVIDIASFVDFIILQETVKNVDGFRRSGYFHRKKSGKIAMGPIWDFNLALGNLKFYGMARTNGWLYQRTHSSITNAFWFKKLIKNKSFRKLLIARYTELRKPGNILSNEAMEARVRNHDQSLQGAGDRDFLRWEKEKNLIESKVMTTQEKADCHREHVEVLSRWIKGRLKWMDENIKKIHKNIGHWEKKKQKKEAKDYLKKLKEETTDVCVAQ